MPGLLGYQAVLKRKCCYSTLSNQFQVGFTVSLLLIVVIFVRSHAQKIDFQSLIHPRVAEQVLLLAHVELMHPQIAEIAFLALANLRVFDDAINLVINAILIAFGQAVEGVLKAA